MFQAPDSYASALVTLKPCSGIWMKTTPASWTPATTGRPERCAVAGKDATLYDRLRLAPASDVEGIVNGLLIKDGVVQRSLMMLNYVLVERF